MTWHMLLTHYCPNFHLAQRIIFAEVQLQRLSSNLFVYSSLSANHTWLFSMQITAFGSAQSGKHSLFFLHAPCLRSARDDRCVNIWKIAHKNLHKSAWFADKKNEFCHPISFHFYLCNHFQFTVFCQWHSSAKSFQSWQSDSHSFNWVRSIMAQGLYNDSSMVYAGEVSLIHSVEASLLTFTTSCGLWWMEDWTGLPLDLCPAGSLC